MRSYSNNQLIVTGRNLDKKVYQNTIDNGIRGEESQIFDDKTPNFSKFIGTALVLGCEILSNGPMDTD